LVHARWTRRIIRLRGYHGDGNGDLKIQVAGVTVLNPTDFVGVDPPAAFTVTINPIEPSQSNQWLINAADAHADIVVTGRN